VRHHLRNQPPWWRSNLRNKLKLHLRMRKYRPLLWSSNLRNNLKLHPRVRKHQPKWWVLTIQAQQMDQTQSQI
jgi:hypothetical protein